jgi:DNA-binding transcriptional LysR family regulator
MNTNHMNHKLMKDNHMNFSQLQCLVALVETGSFTEAAYTLDLTQSTVSHALAALESELGATLLERNRKGVAALTTIGHSIIPHVRALLVQAEAIEQEAKAARGQTSGKLRLGTVLSLCPDVLASVLTRFRTSYPDMEVVLFEGTMQEVSEWIESSIIDVGFVFHSACRIESTLITTDELCVLVPPGHGFHAKTAVTPRELREEGLIMAKAGCASQLMEMAGFEPSRARPQVRYQASDSATILAMVREGLGITLMPRMMLPKKLEGVIALPLDPPQPLPIGLAVRSQAMASPGAKWFVQTALTWTQEQASLLPRAR